LILSATGLNTAQLYRVQQNVHSVMSPISLPSGGNNWPVFSRQVPGLSKKVSAIALGLLDFDTLSDAAGVLDAFVAAGGNAFDMAHSYRGGLTERILGEWQRSRGIRDDIVIIGKGAHPPQCRPEFIAPQLTQSLERMSTGHVDIYFMHRDNPDIPVSEFVDAMDAEVQAGRIRGPFGGSNWTRARFDEAVAYADRVGKRRPHVLSNNFALARMEQEVWPGCVSCTDTDWKSWLLQRGVPNFAWSSQARGFFTDRAGRNNFSDQDMVRAWYSERNFIRRDRTIKLANQLGKNPTNVALAYVLAQPFPMIPVIGPNSIEELRDCLQAFEIILSPEQLVWLEAEHGTDTNRECNNRQL
jgi:aryl-alcohol dehydrogenase-like predicted oxidoreductase